MHFVVSCYFSGGPLLFLVVAAPGGAARARGPPSGGICQRTLAAAVLASAFASSAGVNAPQASVRYLGLRAESTNYSVRRKILAFVIPGSAALLQTRPHLPPPGASRKREGRTGAAPGPPRRQVEGLDPPTAFLFINGLGCGCVQRTSRAPSPGARASARFNVQITADARHNGLGRWSSVEAA